MAFCLHLVLFIRNLSYFFCIGVFILQVIILIMAYYWTAKILNEYCYGSQVYGTATKESDYDYLVVVDGEPEVEEEKIAENDFHYISKTKFLELLENNDIKALECVFSPSNHILKESFKPIFILDKQKMRKSISAICSNSWVKGKKKIIVENEKYIGLKSIFHSIRIMEFANEIISNEAIQYESMNWVYRRLMEMGVEMDGEKLWNAIQLEFKPLYKFIHNNFKNLTNEKFCK